MFTILPIVTNLYGVFTNADNEFKRRVFSGTYAECANWIEMQLVRPKV